MVGLGNRRDGAERPALKTVVFGASGFIGSHVAEQLHSAGHDVIAPLRAGSDRAFLDKIGVRVTQVDFADQSSIEAVASSADVVVNCTAAVQASPRQARQVDVELTRRLIRAASQAGVSRFVQLSTIVVYGYAPGTCPANETTPCRPSHPISKLAVEREDTVRAVARDAGIDYVILRPASTIGARDKTSFFSQLAQAHAANRFPMIDRGMARFSCVDTRDIGRAMAFLAELPEAVGETYLLRGFELSWAQLKKVLDVHRGVVAKTRSVPRPLALGLATAQERLLKNPTLTRYAVEALCHDRIWDDAKLRSAGFDTAYDLHQSIDVALSALGAKENR